MDPKPEPLGAPLLEKLVAGAHFFGRSEPSACMEAPFYGWSRIRLRDFGLPDQEPAKKVEARQQCFPPLFMPEK